MHRQNLFADDPWDVENARLAQPHVLAARRREDGRDALRARARLRRRQDPHALRQQRRCSSSSAGARSSATSKARRSSLPATSCSVPEGRAGLHAFSNPHDEPAPDPRHERGRLSRRRRLSRGGLRLGRDAGSGASARRRSGHHRPVRVPAGPAGPASRAEPETGAARSGPLSHLKRCGASRTCSGCARWRDGSTGSASAASASKLSIGSCTRRSAATRCAGSASPRTPPRRSPRPSPRCGGDSTGARRATSCGRGCSEWRGA